MMHQVLPRSYHPSNGSSSYPGEIPQKREDTERVASFLLSLKHCKSVTPEQTPHSLSSGNNSNKDNSEQRAPHASYTYSTSYTNHHQSPALADKPSSSSAAARADTTTASDIDSTAMPSWETLLGDSTLVSTDDRELVPDALLVAMAQLKPCRLTPEDQTGCYKTRHVGFVGMCCKNCNGLPSVGRYFPNSVRSLAQTTTSQTILKHVGTKCRNSPPIVKAAILQFQRQQATGGRPPRYGSRKIFFQRVWNRLHGTNQQQQQHAAKVGGGDSYNKQQQQVRPTTAFDDADNASVQTPTDVDEEEVTSEADSFETMPPTDKRKNPYYFGDDISMQQAESNKRAKDASYHGGPHPFRKVAV